MDRGPKTPTDWLQVSLLMLAALAAWIGGNEVGSDVPAGLATGLFIGSASLAAVMELARRLRARRRHD